MKIVEDSLRDMIAFSEKQLASEMRRLKAKGNSKKNVKADAYATIIEQLSSMLPKKLPKKGDGPKDDTSDKS